MPSKPDQHSFQHPILCIKDPCCAGLHPVSSVKLDCAYSGTCAFLSPNPLANSEIWLSPQSLLADAGLQMPMHTGAWRCSLGLSFLQFYPLSPSQGLVPCCWAWPQHPSTAHFPSTHTTPKKTGTILSVLFLLTPSLIKHMTCCLSSTHCQPRAWA